MDNKHNNLYTKGYFIKRLKDKNIPCNVLNLEDGIKKWTVVCYPNSYKINISCYKTSKDDFGFMFESSKLKYLVKTLSMDIIYKELNNIITIQETKNE